jgi:ornithine decarboxylase
MDNFASTTAPIHPQIERFVAQHRPATPCLVLALDVVAEKYQALSEALPAATVFYAVKANPEPEVVRLLAGLGAHFDVASPAEIDLCLGCGVSPAAISYGNTIKKVGDIAYAYRLGVRLFAFDSLMELEKLARAAPGAAVVCRLLTSGSGADWPLSGKFGCHPDMVADLLVMAAQVGLDPCGVSFHVGSQQRDPQQWDVDVAQAAAVVAAVARAGISIRVLNLGGGFPAHYLEDVPTIEDYADAIAAAVERHFGEHAPALVVEPGRYVAGDAGVLVTEVVLVARKAYGDRERWVYLDTGVFGGLAETLGESIKYRLLLDRRGGRTDRDPGATGPVILAGPTCDSLDVMYQRHRYHLPLDLEEGDRILFLSAGAYTKAYCTDGFNGFVPMPAHCLPLQSR